MNKKVKIILAIIIIIILFALVIWLIQQKNKGYIIIGNGYSSYESKIISNYTEYVEFVNYMDSQNKAYGKVHDFNSNKYNEKYFDSKSLAIINIVIGNGSNVYKNIDISIESNTLICKTKIKQGKGITDDINGKMILIEIDKSVTNFIIE